MNISVLPWNDRARVGSIRYRSDVRELFDLVRAEVRELGRFVIVRVADNLESGSPALQEFASLADVKIGTVIPVGLDSVREPFASARVVVGSRAFSCHNAISVFDSRSENDPRLASAQIISDDMAADVDRMRTHANTSSIQVEDELREMRL